MTDATDAHEEFVLKRYSDRAPPPCQDHDRRLALMEQAIYSLKITNEGIVTKLDLLIVQTTKVALLEERHLSQAEDLQRAHVRLADLDKDFKKHMHEAEAFINHSKGRDKVLWAMGGVVMALLVKALFFAAHIPV